MYEEAITMYFLGNLLLSFAALILVFFIIARFTPTKSKQYRKYVANMLVANKIRDIAKKENLNLENEELAYDSWVRKYRVKILREVDDKVEEQYNSEIDKTIEGNLRPTEKPIKQNNSRKSR